jgi:hypothetical protein
MVDERLVFVLIQFAGGFARSRNQMRYDATPVSSCGHGRGRVFDDNSIPCCRRVQRIRAIPLGHNGGAPDRVVAASRGRATDPTAAQRQVRIIILLGLVSLAGVAYQQSQTPNRHKG